MLQSAADLPDFAKVSFPDMPPLDLASTFPSIPPPALPLLRRLLVLEPCRRISAAEVSRKIRILYIERVLLHPI
jgi:hypothetical protein